LVKHLIIIIFGSDFANWSDTFTYEFLCSLGKRAFLNTAIGKDNDSICGYNYGWECTDPSFSIGGSELIQ
jgi:hypothetical protein